MNMLLHRMFHLFTECPHKIREFQVPNKHCKNGRWVLEVDGQRIVYRCCWCGHETVVKPHKGF